MSSMKAALSSLLSTSWMRALTKSAYRYAPQSGYISRLTRLVACPKTNMHALARLSQLHWSSSLSLGLISTPCLAMSGAAGSIVHSQLQCHRFNRLYCCVTFVLGKQKLNYCFLSKTLSLRCRSWSAFTARSRQAHLKWLRCHCMVCQPRLVRGLRICCQQRCSCTTPGTRGSPHLD